MTKARPANRQSPPRRRGARPWLETLEDRTLLSNWIQVADADGYVADANLDGVFDTVNTTGNVVQTTLIAAGPAIDQSNTASPYQVYSTSYSGHQPMGQEFRPTGSSLNYVDLFLEDAGSDIGPGANFQVRIHAGTITGAVLGTSVNTFVADGTNTGGGSTYTRFNFASPITLTPNATYVMEIQQIGSIVTGNMNFGLAGDNPSIEAYSAGRAIIGGVAVTSGFDFLFREGTTPSQGGVSERGVMEFTVAGIPTNSVITSARIAGTLSLVEGSSVDVGFYGYAGNGQITTADANASSTRYGQLLNPATGAFSVNLNPSLVQSFIRSAGHAGILGFVVKLSSGQRFWLTSTENPTALPPKLEIVYDATNVAPTAVNNSYTVNAGQSFVAVQSPGVLGNDSDPNGDALTAILVSDPSQGSVTLNSNGSFTYTPNAGATGSDSFTYKANDGQLDSNVATVTFNFNDAPVANNDSYSVNEDGTLMVPAPGVKANDFDPNGNPTSVTVLTTTTRGSLTFNYNDASFTYRPNPNYNGTDSFTYRLWDGFANSNVATVTINVNPINDAPVAVSNSYSVQEDTPLTVLAPGLLGNDTDVDGNTLTAVQVTSPTKGSLSLSADGSFVYTPNANVTGSDSFTYRANDGTVNSNTATVSITITAVNDAPVGQPDTYSVHRGATLSIQNPGVLINDTDAEGNPLTAILVAGPANGSVTLNSNGSFSYTPVLGFIGQDTFTYKPRDGSADGNVTTVTMNVQDINDVPIAFSNSYTTAQDTPLNVAGPGVLGNDTDANRDPLTAILQVGPGNGALTLNADGSFLYTPNAGFGGNDSFTYRANDGIASGNIASVSIRVNGVPVAQDDAYSTNEDTPLSIATPGVRGNDTDSNGDPLTVIKVSDPTKGFLILNSNGSFNYTPFSNANGIDTFRYKVNDGYADSNIATVTITINPINDAPIANSNGYSIAEEGVLNVNGPGVLGNDTDPEGNPLTAELVAGPSNGSIVFNSDGSFVYTPRADFHGTDIFTYRASDGTLSSAPANVQITVTRVNDAPVAVDDAFSVDEDATLTFSVGAPVTYLYLNSQPGDYIGQGQTQTFTPATGTFSTSSAVDNVASFSYFDTLNPGKWWHLYFASPWDTTLTAGAYLNATRWPFQAKNVPGLSVSGEGRGSNGLTGQFTVLQAQYDQAGHVVRFAANFEQHSEGAPPALFGEMRYNYLPNVPGLLANDRDVESHALTAILVAGPSHGTLSVNANGTFSYTPDRDFFGTDTFTYKANDGALDSNIATVTITVNSANDDPVIANNDAYVLNEDVPLTVPVAGVLANDVNVDSDPLTAILVSGPTNGSVTLNTNGSFIYTPNANYNGSDSFTYKVNDGHTDSNVATVTLTINAVNDVPTALADSYMLAEDGSLNVPGPGVLGNDSDVEGAALTAVLGVGPVNGALQLGADGSFTYTPNANFNGVDSFTYKARDGALDSNSVSVTLTITPVNDAPVAEAGPNQTVGEASTVSFNGGASFDGDGDALTYAWTFGDGQTGSGPAPTHVYADNGIYTVALTVNDGRGGQHADTLTVTVNNLPPTASISGPTSGARGQERAFSFGAVDPSAVDQTAGFTFTIDWGDGSPASGAQGPQAAHVFTASGTYQVRVTARDKDGGEHIASQDISIVAAQMQGQTLVIGGTTAGDTITISPNDSAGNVKVVINGAQQGTFAPSDINVYGQAGNDTIELRSARIGNKTYHVTDPAILFGDDGNDTLDARGSTAANLLLGGAGADQIFGGSGRDMLFGGLGADLLRGGGNDDILIAALTDFDANLTALLALRSEWTRTDAIYATRVGHLLGGISGGLNGTYKLNASTVHDDAASDQLYGEGDTDWFLYAFGSDQLKDKKGSETATTI